MLTQRNDNGRTGQYLVEVGVQREPAVTPRGPEIPCAAVAPVLATFSIHTAPTGVTPPFGSRDASH